MKETKESVVKDTKSKLDFLKNKKFIIAIVAVVLIIAIILTIFLLTRKKVKFKNESNGIKYSANFNSDSELLVVMQNNTDRVVSKLKLVVSYYNSNGNELTKNTKVTDVGYLKNKEISLEDVEPHISNTQDIADYKIEITPEFYEGEDKQSKYEKIEIGDLADKKDKTTVKIKNTSDDEINRVCFFAVYFKRGIPVGFDANDVFSLEKGEEKELSFEKPKNSDGKEVDYSFCKVFIKY